MGIIKDPTKLRTLANFADKPAKEYLKNDEETHPLVKAAIWVRDIGGYARRGQAFASALGYTRAASFLGGAASLSNPATWGLTAAWGITEIIDRRQLADIEWRRNQQSNFYSQHRGLPIRQRTICESHHPARFSSSLQSSHERTSHFLRSQFSTFSTVGYPSSYSSREFRNVIRATGLVDSYNRIHPESRIEHARERHGEIGGVASAVGRIKGLKNSVTDVLFDEHIFCLETTDNALLFTDSQFKQIIRELIFGIFIQDTYPFFSLHFNNSSSMFPVLHYAYQKTSVGKIIGLIDYFMKGFLNGGIFSEEFLFNWPDNQNLDREFLKAHLIDLKKEYKKNKLAYTSLREKMCALGLELPPDVSINEATPSVFNNKFRTSFRIIAKQKEIRMHDKLFFINPDFDVEHTIETLPEYQEYLDEYYRNHGEYPKDYQQLIALYIAECKDIKENMSKLPLFKKYFQMLGVINFFCYYLTTLKDMGKSLDLPTVGFTPTPHFPKVMPPIPVRYYKYQPLYVTVGDVLTTFNAEEQLKLNQLLRDNIENDEDGQGQYDEIVDAVFGRILEEKNISPEVMLQENFIEEIIAIENKFIELLKLKSKIYKVQLLDAFKKLIGEYELDIDTAHFFELKTLTEQFEALKQAAQNKLESDTQQLELTINTFNSENASEIEQAKQAAINENINAINNEIEEAINKFNGNVDSRIQEDINKLTQEINVNRDNSLREISSEWSKLSHSIQIIPANQATYSQAINNCHAEYNNLFTNGSNDIKNHYANLKITKEQEIRATGETLKNESKEKVLAAFQTQIKSNIQADIKTDNENCCNAIEDLQTQINNQYQKLIVSNVFKSQILIDQIKFSNLSIADEEYHNELGDNHKIVGGCGMKLPSVKQKAIPNGEKMVNTFSAALKNMSHEEMTNVNYENKSYTVFKLKTKNQLAYSLLDYADLLDSSVTSGVPMSENELTAMSELAYEKISDDDVTLPAFNPAARDKSGQAVIHYVSAFAGVKQLEKILRDNEQCLRLIDDHGNFPIHIAAMSGNVEAINYFVNVDKSFVDIKFVDIKNSNGYTPLLLAAQHGHTDSVEKLITLGADVNYTLPNGLFALYIAIQEKHEKTALALIDKTNSNLNLILDNGESALHLAIEMRQTNVALALIARGADVNLKRKTDGLTPFQCAASTSLLEVCEAIYTTGKVDVNALLTSQKTVSHVAATSGHLDVLKFLHQTCNANINAKNAEGLTPIMSALQQGQVETALYLADHVEINLINNEGQSASNLAGMMGQFNVADVLINRGENPLLNDKNNLNYIYYLLRTGQYNRYKSLSEKITVDPNFSFNHMTSLDIAARFGHPLLMDYLLQKNADYTLNKILGWEIIHFAVKANHLSYLKKWLRKYKEINQAIEKDEEQIKKLLYIAAENGSLECLRELLKTAKTSDLNNTFENENLLYAALKSGKKKIIDTVLATCSDVNISIDENQNTISHVAAKFGSVDLIQYFYSYGVNFNSRNKRKQTCFHLALLNEDVEFLTELFKLIAVENWPDNFFVFAATKDKLECLEKVAKKLKNTSHHLLFQKALKKVWDASSMMVKHSVIRNRDGNTILHKLVRNEKVDSVEHYLKDTVDVDVKNEKGQTPFMLAVQSGNIKMVQLLLARGVDVNCKDIQQKTALHYAITRQQIYIALLLIPLIKNVNAKDAQGNTPLMNAVIHGNLSLVKTISAKNPGFKQFNKQGDNALHLAAIYGHKEIVNFLVELGFDIDAKENFKDEKKANLYSKLSSLQLAATQGNIETCETLISLGANLQNENEFAEDFIEIAIQSHKPEMISLIKLLNIELKPQHVITAAANDNIQMLSELLLMDADIDVQNEWGQSALHAACINNSEKTASLLIEQGIALDVADRDGNFSIHEAARSGSVRILRELCTSKTLLDKTNNKNDTPLHFAAANGHLAAAILLLKAGATLDKRNKENLTPTLLALQKGFLPLAKLLIIFGDRSFLSNNLPNYLQDCMRAFKWELKAIEEAINQVESAKGNVIHLAIKLKDAVALHLLCQLHPELINEKNANGNTPLQFAEIKNNEEAAGILLEHQAKCEIQNNVETIQNQEGSQTIASVSMLRP